MFFTLPRSNVVAFNFSLGCTLLKSSLAHSVHSESNNLKLFVAHLQHYNGTGSSFF
jgi:hypothetical protein